MADLDDATQRLILQAFLDRVFKDDDLTIGACPLCRQSNWATGGGFVTVPLTMIPMQLAPSATEAALPLFPLVCRVCGNTVFLNLYALDLHELVRELNPKIPPFDVDEGTDEAAHHG